MARRRRPGAVGRTALLWVAILSLAVGVGGGLAPPSIEAASVNSVQTNSVTMSATPTLVTLPTPVDATKAFVICSSQTGSQLPEGRVTCELSDTTVTITMGGGTTFPTVRWYVVEFTGGVSVQRGLASFLAAGLTPSVAPSLSAVTLSKSFVLISERYASATRTLDEQWTVRAQLTGSTTLDLSRNESGLALGVAWQVIEMDGATVQRGTTTLLAGGATATAALSPAVDITKSFIIMSRKGGTSIAGVEAEYQVHAGFSSITGNDAAEVTFTRVSTTTTAAHQDDIAWEVITLDDGSAVVRGTTGQLTAFGSATTTLTSSAFSAVDLTTTVPFVSLAGGSGTTNTHLDDTSWTAVLNATTLTFTRAVSSTVATQLSWFAVSFFKCTTVSDASFVTANGQSGQATVYWPSATALIGRKTVAFVSTDVPVSGKTYAVSDPIGTATVVDNQSVAASSFNQTGLDTSGATTYYYKVFPKTVGTGPCYAPGTAPGVEVNVTPKGGAGSPNWSYATGATTLAPPGLTDGGVVVTGSNNNKLHGMSASVGTQSFTPFATGNAIQARPPVIPNSLSSTGNTIAYVTSQDGKVYAVDTSTGLLFSGWTTPQLGTQLQGGAAVWLQAVKGLDFGCTSNPDLVVVGTRSGVSDNKVYGLHGGGGDCSNIGVSPGGAIWTFTPPGNNMDIISSTPLIDYNPTNGAIWVTSRSNSGTQPSLWKLNAADGTLVTSGSLSLGDIDGSPSNSLDGSFLYVPTNAGTLKAINMSGTPAVVATHTPTGGAGAIKGFPLPFSFSPPSVGTPDTIVFSRDATVHSVSFNGTSFGENWTTPPTGSPTAISVPIDNFADPRVVYVGANDGKIHELVLSTGVDAKQVTIVPGTPTGGDPSFDITLNRVYVGATDGHIYAFPSPF